MLFGFYPPELPLWGIFLSDATSYKSTTKKIILQFTSILFAQFILLLYLCSIKIRARQCPLSITNKNRKANGNKSNFASRPLLQRRRRPKFG